MEWPEVERRIAAGEDARTEFKRGANDLRGIGKTLCAFANGDGGLIVLGVEVAGFVRARNASRISSDTNCPAVFLSRLASAFAVARTSSSTSSVVRIGCLLPCGRLAPPPARLSASTLVDGAGARLWPGSGQGVKCRSCP